MPASARDDDRKSDHFTVATAEVGGEVLVRTDQIGLAATYLELMRADCTLPVPAWQPGQRVGVAAIGTAVRSNSPELEVGDLVQSMTGWSEYSAGPAGSYVKQTAEGCAHDVLPWPLGDDAGSIFDSLSYSGRRRVVQPIEQARTAETRQRRIAKSAAALREHRLQP